jgi:hypothetical protein
MTAQKMHLANVAFKQGIMSTFGKLDDFDIDKISGSPERLLTTLMDRYGWSPSYAKLKVETFLDERLAVPA